MDDKQRIIIIIVVIIISGVSFIVGLFIRKMNVVNDDLPIHNIVQGQTFYAKIESKEQYNDGSIHLNVKGLEVNDINYRGNFTFKVDDSIKIIWRDEEVKVSDLKEESNISITFDDKIINGVSPTILEDVVKIQILDDEI